MPRFSMVADNQGKGVLAPRDPALWRTLLAKMPNKVYVTVEHLRSPRSLAQNRKMWKTYELAAEQLSEDTGHTVKEIHEYLKEEYCPETEINVCGRVLKVKSTALLDKPKMSAYIERCMAFFAHQGIEIPERGD